MCLYWVISLNLMSWDCSIMYFLALGPKSLFSSSSRRISRSSYSLINWSIQWRILGPILSSLSSSISWKLTIWRIWCAEVLGSTPSFSRIKSISISLSSPSECGSQILFLLLPLNCYPSCSWLEIRPPSKGKPKSITPVDWYYWAKRFNNECLCKHFWVFGFYMTEIGTVLFFDFIYDPLGCFWNSFCSIGFCAAELIVGMA